MRKKLRTVSAIGYGSVIAVSLLLWSYSAFAGEIHDAAQVGDLAKVKSLVGKNHDILSSRDDRGITPLYYAALNGRTEVVKYLIERGADVNETLSNRMSPLHVAASKYKEIVLLLVNNGADVNLNSYDDSSPLHSAAYSGNIEIAEILLNKGAKINTPDNEGETPLSEAVFGKHKAMVELLLQRGADVNAKNRDGWTPLHRASMHYPDDIATLLESHGAVDLPKDEAVIKGNNIPFIPELLKKYPLHYTAWCGDLGKVKTILKKNPELLNSKDYSQSTPLLVATAAGKRNVVQFLLDQGADATIKNNIGWVPVVVATYFQMEDLVKMIEKHCKLERVTWGDIMKNQPFISERLVQYPIHYAALNGDLNKVKLLLAKNPSMLDSRDYSQSTPLLVATHVGKKDVVQFFLEKGADVNIQNAVGTTAAIDAFRSHREDLLDMIRKYAKNKKKNSYKSGGDGHPAKQDEWMEDERLFNAMLLKDMNTIDEFLEKNPKRINSKQNSLLIIAAMFDDKELIEYFVGKGENINIRENGWTPLHKAAENNKIIAVKTLLDFHADINSKAAPGYTPLHLAAKQGHTEIVDILIKRGADVNAHDNYGDTPLSDAIKNNQKDVILLIQKAGGKEQ